MATKGVKLAVYGTLKAGHGNHRLLQAAIVHSYRARVEGFTLYGHGIPYAVPTQGSAVAAEVYYLADPDGSVLASLDRLEGHPTHYCRTLVSAKDAAGKVESVWMYVRAGDNTSLGDAPRIGSFWPPAWPARYSYRPSDGVSGGGS